MDIIINHLQKQHRLVSEVYCVGIGIAIDSRIGVGLGLAIGAAFDAKARKRGRIICPKETNSATTKNFKITAIILGLIILAGLTMFLLFRQIS